MNQILTRSYTAPATPTTTFRADARTPRTASEFLQTNDRLECRPGRTERLVGIGTGPTGAVGSTAAAESTGAAELTGAAEVAESTGAVGLTGAAESTGAAGLRAPLAAAASVPGSGKVGGSSPKSFYKGPLSDESQ